MTELQWYSNLKNGLKIYTELTDFPPQTFGFVYKIQHKDTKRYYIGKKQLYTNKHKETKWQNYWGSSIDFTEYINREGKEMFTRQIINICLTKKQLGYFEVYQQMNHNVLEDKLSYNKSIAGRYFTKDFD